MRKNIIAAVIASVMTVSGTFSLLSGNMFVNAADNDLCINEVCSQNKSCLADSYGKYSDWIEIYNSGNTDIDVSGYGLSDKADVPLKFVFPANTVIRGGEHFVVFASAQESTGNELHTGFSISKNGENLYLSNSNGTIISQVEVPTLGEDCTYGRTPDGSEKFEIMQPTPKAENAYVISAPTFSKGSGFYGTDFSLTLDSAANTTIYYTLDGTDPTTSNTAIQYSGSISVQDRTNQPNIYSKYEENNTAQSITNGVGYKQPPFNVEKATVVRAAAKSSDGKYSSVVNQTYFITNGNLAKYKDMSVVSLVTNPDNLFDPDTGIYVVGNQFLRWKNSSAYDPNKSIWDADNVTNYFSKGKVWEREADITFFENGQAVVQQGMGIRIKGASTRNHGQKSFNLYARSNYGASKIEYPLLPDNYDIEGKLIDKYDSITLRSVTDAERLNDGLSQGLLEDRDALTTQNMKPCVVFLNGEYWGLYIMTERISDYFIESNYGIQKEDVAILKNEQLEEGEQADFDSFYSFVEEYAKRDLTNDSNYKAVCDFIDIDSLIEHYAAGIYLGTFDWPNFNYGVWKNKGEAIEGNPYSDGKWRFITFDLDYTVGGTYSDFGGVEGYAYDSFCHIAERSGNPTGLFLNLLKNKEFRDKFAAVYCDYANEVAGADKGVARTEMYSNKYADLLADNLTRWWGYFGSPQNETFAWNKQDYQGKVIQRIKTFFSKRGDYTLEDMKNYLGLSGTLQYVTLRTNGHGSIKINSITPDLSNGLWRGKYFTDCPITLTAIPDEGYSFSGWSNGSSDSTITVTLKETMEFTAEFGEKKTVAGDVNADGNFNIADVVALQKWILADENAGLADWKAADINSDDKLDSADLSLMRRMLINK